MGFIFNQDKRTYSRRLHRRLKGQRLVYGERLFPWHERKRLNVFRLVLAVVLVAGVLLSTSGAALAVAGVAFYGRDLPSVDVIFDRPIAQSTLIYDREGNLLNEVYDPDKGRRILTPLSQMGEYIVNATLAAEDPNFYTTPGFDPTAFVRAVYLNYTSGGIVSGASTLSMQLVRNVLFDEEERTAQSYVRKTRETLLAVDLALRYPKDSILEMYLNEVFYGNHAYGAQAAALSYFGKELKELSLAEAALLAGLPQSPTTYNPYVNAEFAVRRQHYVLDQMVKYNLIGQQDAEEAKAQTLYLGRFQSRYSEAPHFANHVRDLLIERYGYDRVYYGGLRVVTSIDLGLQRIATSRAKEHIEKLKASNANNAAVVSIDPKTGEVLAMVGSVDFENAEIDGQVNMAVALRQPGSSIKPFNYVTAFQKMGYLPATMVNDEPTEFPQLPGQPTYRPQNFNLRFSGWVPIRNALGNSMNVPPVKILAQTGVPAMIDTAHSMGIRSLDGPPEQYGLAITLGAAEVRPLEITFAYTVFANNGQLNGALVPPERQKPGYAEYEPVIIKSVRDYKGEVLYQHTPKAPVQAVPAEYAYLITSILSDDSARVMTYGPHSYLELSRPAAAKTGTTEFRSDGWTIGYTPDLVTGVWVGNADNTPMVDVAGVSGAGVIWHNVMEDALKERPVQSFQVPPKVRQGEVCGRQEIYIEGKPIVCSAG